MSPGSGRRNAVVTIDSAGPRPAWWREDRSYDLVVLPRGPKWPALARFVAQEGARRERWSAVWFPDPQVEAPAELVDLLFALHEELGADVSHPAVEGSAGYGWALVRRHAGFSVRFSEVVDTVAPLFRSTALAACAATFARSTRGAGLPQAWHALLEPRPRSFAVLDCLPVDVTHVPRPAPPRHEGTSLATAHGVPAPWAPRLLGGLDEGFGVLDRVQTLTRAAAHLGLRAGIPPVRRSADGTDPEGSGEAAYASTVAVDLLVHAGSSR